MVSRSIVCQGFGKLCYQSRKQHYFVDMNISFAIIFYGLVIKDFQGPMVSFFVQISELIWKQQA